MVRKLVKFFNLLHVALVYLAEFLLVAMVVLIFANVVLRYVFNSGIIWSEETALLIAVWFSFIAMALGVKHRLHIHINLLSSAHIPPQLDTILWKIRDVVVVVVGAAMLWWGWILVGFTMRSILPATGLPAGVLYAVVPIAAVVIIYEGIVHLLNVDTGDEIVNDYLAGNLPFQSILTGRNPTGQERPAGRERPDSNERGGDHA
ncbi:MAG TPA: TRAP transporter small permease [Spirochaetia bacterium]|nr:TRAP transporter small permease [Spirochaetia bacterium]